MVGVVTAPQKFSISYRPEGVVNVLHADVESYCMAKHIPTYKINNGMKSDALFNQVRTWNPDIFLVAGWYHMLPKKWLELTPAYGLHASLLPDYSGGAPLVWAMINGEKQTGITLFKFNSGVDNGPILGQKRTTIYETDTIATLYVRIEKLGLELIQKNIPALTNGTAILTPQDDSQRRIFPQRGPEDGIIDWSRTAMELHNFIRAQTRPYPGAFTTWKGKRLTIWKAQESTHTETQELKHGEVSHESKAMLINTRNNFIEVLEVTYGQQEITGQELKKIIGMGAVLGT
ncbi:MAG: methionyl-tRNA formyltransferase [Desulfobacterium sp.]|nr:methionyl-tRNA formyltransferase [Desulfobacterium sp.]